MTETEAPTRTGTAEVLPQPSFEPLRSPRVTVIRPAARWPHLDLVEVWRYRELLLTLAWRDVAVRYRQTAFGVAWAILQPFLTMVVFTFIFGRFANFPSKGVPYPIFTYSALLPWTYFASAVNVAAGSIVGNKPLVTKVYFPRVLLPLAGVTVPLVDLALACSVLVGLMFWFHVWPSFAILLAPFFILVAIVTALGVGLFFSAVNVRYRDVAYAIPFVMQIWLYLSGVVYAANALPQRWQWLLAFNPMTAVINGFQWGILGGPTPEFWKTAIGIASALVIFVVGLEIFRRSEPRFADTM